MDGKGKYWYDSVRLSASVSELLRSHQQVFAQDDDDVGLTQTVKHRIYTTDESPVKAAYRRVPPPRFDKSKHTLRISFTKG